jgi:hypothetical protein
MTKVKTLNLLARGHRGRRLSVPRSAERCALTWDPPARTGGQGRLAQGAGREQKGQEPPGTHDTSFSAPMAAAHTCLAAQLGAARTSGGPETHQELFSPRLRCWRWLKRPEPRCQWLRGPRPRWGSQPPGRRAPLPGARCCPLGSWARGPGAPRRPPPPEPAGRRW